RKRHFGMSKDLEVKDPKKFKELPRIREAGARMPKALTVQSDRERLLGMLEDLEKEELEKFKWFLRDSDVLVDFQPIPESKLEKTSTCNLVDLMFGAYTQHTVEVTKKVVTMTTKKLLIETLNQLSPEDFAEFKSHIAVEKDLQLMSQSRLKTANTQDVVELMEQTYRGECVEETRKALMKMNRTDLVQRLSDKQFPPLSQRVETMESLIELLLETLADLSYSEVKDFIEILRRKRGSLSPTSLLFMSDLHDVQDMQDVQDVVFLMVRTFGQQSVKKIVEVLKEVKRTDLAQRLTDSSSEAQ
ncbi:unnamed protein product, partial [Oreochromis niloticus]